MSNHNESIQYINAKAHVIRAINRATTFVKASIDFNNERSNIGKPVKISQMLLGLNDLRINVENDIQIMKTAVGQKTAPEDVIDNKCSACLIDSFDSIYYELAAFLEVHNFPLSPKFMSLASLPPGNQSNIQNNLSCLNFQNENFQLFPG